MLTLKRSVGEVVVLREGATEVRLTLADIGPHEIIVQLDTTEKMSPRSLPHGGSFTIKIGEQLVEVVVYKRAGHAAWVAISAPESVHILREELESLLN